MRAGKLRHRVTIQKNTPTRDTDGAEIDSWSNVATVWGAVEYLSGNERYVDFGAQDSATANVRITIRYRASLDPSMRVTWKGTAFDILEARPDPTFARQIELYCEAQVAVDRSGVDTGC